jgi:hypothetical protein
VGSANDPNNVEERKILPLLSAIRPLAKCYTDCAIALPKIWLKSLNKNPGGKKTVYFSLEFSQIYTHHVKFVFTCLHSEILLKATQLDQTLRISCTVSAPGLKYLDDIIIIIIIIIIVFYS